MMKKFEKLMKDEEETKWMLIQMRAMQQYRVRQQRYLRCIRRQPRNEKKYGEFGRRSRGGDESIPKGRRGNSERESTGPEHTESQEAAEASSVNLMGKRLKKSAKERDAWLASRAGKSGGHIRRRCGFWSAKNFRPYLI
jgi:hypothetical protein